jgi:hypothetical protein
VCQGPRLDALKLGFCGGLKKDPTEIAYGIVFPKINSSRKWSQNMDVVCAHSPSSESWTENSGLEGLFIPTMRCCGRTSWKSWHSINDWRNPLQQIGHILGLGWAPVMSVDVASCCHGVASKIKNTPWGRMDWFWACTHTEHTLHIFIFHEKRSWWCIDWHHNLVLRSN